MFRQDRTNPSTAISNWRGRHDTPKAWPSTAVSSWLNGGLFGGFNAIEATGGTISDYTNSTDGFQYRSHTFNASGTFTITANPDGHTFDVLVVGAGGGTNGTGNYVGAGGGGEVTKELGETGTVEAYTVTVGAGVTSNTGGTTTFVSAPGTSPAVTGVGGESGSSSSGDSGSGNAGGSTSGSGAGGGGGGDGGVGVTATTVIGAPGGPGTTNTEFQAGSSTFGGGGGGGSKNGYPIGHGYGAGGSGGGGHGGTMGWQSSGIPAAVAGTANTGGGSGGNGDKYGPGQPSQSFAGGSGIVIVRYALEDTS